MALSCIIRNASKTSGFANILKNTVTVSTRKPYSQLLNRISQNVCLPARCARNDQFLVKRSMSADHSKLWGIEKAVSIALLGVVPATFLTPNIILDDLFAILTVVHFHWGLEACAVDYIRPIIFGAAIPKLALGLLYIISIATLGGLLYYNHDCIGIGQTVRKFWEIKK
ncbi:succinate dehydrogenase, subunit D [Leptinotarsa decemlineata]|uniref:succinate dehydrogenase, subunit D n=1 Tax=Leptinotarsa decemlineata TaxID=7539 RepID=UPI000C251D2D|nr:succinate dehydrogenase [ubiquinone] cytochrome b small subunit, mitochondrial [Leptinotarsa decemlineata]